jgi:hypothetical protein
LFYLFKLRAVLPENTELPVLLRQLLHLCRNELCRRLGGFYWFLILSPIPQKTSCQYSALRSQKIRPKSGESDSPQSALRQIPDVLNRRAAQMLIFMHARFNGYFNSIFGHQCFGIFPSVLVASVDLFTPKR